MKELFETFSALQPISPELKEALLQLLKRKEVAKKTFLLKKGHVCDYIFFIEEGMFRCFYEIHEKEVCSWFMKEKDVIISVESFYSRIPSYESIQAIEDAVVYYISYNELQHLYSNFPEFNSIGRQLTEKYYALSEQRLYSLRSQKAEERYALLRNHFPEIVKRVPSGYIASYLGITIETLSRIKKSKRSLKK